MSLWGEKYMRYPLITYPFAFAALSSSLILGVPVHAQTEQRQPLSADRAIVLMQNEAAIQLNTFYGNTAILEFSSDIQNTLLVGYTATIQLKGAETQVFCSIDLNEIVQCNDPNSSASSQSTVAVDERCGPERPQETLLDHTFTQNIYGTLNDYSVRIYYNDDVVNRVRYLCMNVYDVRNQFFIGAMPARASSSSSTIAYYSEQPLDGIDYQVILNPDGRYMFRRSQGASLLYEGLSR